MADVSGPSVLVVIGEDPRSSHRANEALRIALGVAAGETPVRVVLLGAGHHLLDEDTDALVDGDDIAKFRSALRRLDIPVHVEAGAMPADGSWNPDGFAIVPAGPDDLTALAASATRFLIF